MVKKISMQSYVMQVCSDHERHYTKESFMLWLHGCFITLKSGSILQTEVSNTSLWVQIMWPLQNQGRHLPMKQVLSVWGIKKENSIPQIKSDGVWGRGWKEVRGCGPHPPIFSRWLHSKNKYSASISLKCRDYWQIPYLAKSIW